MNNMVVYIQCGERIIGKVSNGAWLDNLLIEVPGLGHLSARQRQRKVLGRTSP